MDCMRFWAGQVGQLDPLRYDKFYKDATYIRDQYLIAENCLNIISQKPTVSAEEQKKIQRLDKGLQRQREQIARMENILTSLSVDLKQKIVDIG